MSGEVRRFDCTSGGAQHCYGCYTMTEVNEGDYVAWDDYADLLARSGLDLDPPCLVPLPPFGQLGLP